MLKEIKRNIVITYGKDEPFNYVIEDGHIWLTYIAAISVRRYVAVIPNNGHSKNICVSGF